MFVGSFGGDFNGFMSDVAGAIGDFKKAGVTKLLIDLTNNGGGYVCLGQYLFQYLSGSDFGYPYVFHLLRWLLNFKAQKYQYSGFVSTTRGNELAQKIVTSDIKLGLDAYYSFYTPDNCECN
jgi:hypothetical protein